MKAPPRLAKLRPSEMDAAQRSLYDRITTGERAAGPQLFPLVDADGALEGPFNALCLSPVIGDAVQELGAALRYHSTLTRRATEIAILIVATAWESAFERSAHEAIGRHIGLSEAELSALRDGGPVGSDEYEVAVARTAHALVGPQRDLLDDEYAEAVEVLGETTVFELVALCGYYSLLALQLRAFRVAP